MKKQLLAIKQELQAQAERKERARAAYDAHKISAPTQAELDAIWASREEESTSSGSKTGDRILKDKYGL